MSGTATPHESKLLQGHVFKQQPKCRVPSSRCTWAPTIFTAKFSPVHLPFDSPQTETQVTNSNALHQFSANLGECCGNESKSHQLQPTPSFDVAGLFAVASNGAEGAPACAQLTFLLGQLCGSLLATIGLPGLSSKQFSLITLRLRTTSAEGSTKQTPRVLSRALQTSVPG